jgi:hypothetical protein
MVGKLVCLLSPVHDAISCWCVQVSPSSKVPIHPWGPVVLGSCVLCVIILYVVGVVVLVGVGLGGDWVLGVVMCETLMGGVALCSCAMMVLHPMVWRVIVVLLIVHFGSLWGVVIV